MKRIFMAASLFTFSVVAYAGGSMGGGGLGKEQQLELTLILANNANLLNTIPDLGLEKFAIDVSTYRRARARLAISDIVPVSIDGQDLSVRILSGGIVDLSETTQIVPAAP